MFSGLLNLSMNVRCHFIPQHVTHSALQSSHLWLCLCPTATRLSNALREVGTSNAIHRTKCHIFVNQHKPVQKFKSLFLIYGKKDSGTRYCVSIKHLSFFLYHETGKKALKCGRNRIIHLRRVLIRHQYKRIMNYFKTMILSIRM